MFTEGSASGPIPARIQWREDWKRFRGNVTCGSDR